MKKYLGLFAAVSFVIAVGLGCSLFGNSDSSQTDSSNTPRPSNAVNSGNGQSNVAIPECMAVLEDVETELNNPEDSFVAKAAKGVVLNRIKESIRQEIEQNANRAELIKACIEFKKQLDNYKASQQPSNRQ